MPHPSGAHRSIEHSHARLADVLGDCKDYKRGGHADAASDRKVVRSMVKSSALKVGGAKPPHRVDRARGGRVGKKKAHTIVNVITGHPGAAATPPPGPAPAPMAAPMAAAPRPPMMPPPGAGAPPPMPPMGGGIRAYGGRTYARGGAVKGEGAMNGDGVGAASTGGNKPGPAYNGGLRAGTQVQHSGNKSDGANIGRGKPITFKRGGRVGSDNQGSPKSQSKANSAKASPPNPVSDGRYATGGRIEAPTGTVKGDGVKLPGGSGGGKARMAKEERAKRLYVKPPKGMSNYKRGGKV